MESDSSEETNRFGSNGSSITSASSKRQTDDMKADTEMLWYLKSMLLSLSAFVVILLYFAAWLSTRNVFPIERDANRSAALRAYLHSLQWDSKPIETFDQFRDSLMEKPALKYSICKNFSEYQCQNWFMLMTDEVGSYQEFLVRHQEFVTEYNFTCASQSLLPLEWNPLECPRDSVRLPLPIDEEFRDKIDTCVRAALHDAGAVDYDWGEKFHPFFVIGMCRLALHSSFMDLMKELQAVCISGCGVRPSPDVDWSVLCLALSYYASAVRTAYDCTSSREAAKTCEHLRGFLGAACVG